MVAMATAARSIGRSWPEISRISFARTTTKRARATPNRRATDWWGRFSIGITKYRTTSNAAVAAARTPVLTTWDRSNVLRSSMGEGVIRATALFS